MKYNFRYHSTNLTLCIFVVLHNLVVGYVAEDMVQICKDNLHCVAQMISLSNACSMHSWVLLGHVCAQEAYISELQSS